MGITGGMKAQLPELDWPQMNEGDCKLLRSTKLVERHGHSQCSNRFSDTYIRHGYAVRFERFRVSSLWRKDWKSSPAANFAGKKEGKSCRIVLKTPMAHARCPSAREVDTFMEQRASTIPFGSLIFLTQPTCGPLQAVIASTMEVTLAQDLLTEMAGLQDFPTPMAMWESFQGPARSLPRILETKLYASSL